VAGDSHDAVNDPASDAHTWKVTGQSPPAGTLVARSQKINLTVVRDLNQPVLRRPVEPGQFTGG